MKIISTTIGMLLLAVTAACAQETNLAVIVRHAPTLNNGRLQGSLQELKGENVTLNGGFTMTGDLLVPGTPTVILNGHPTYAGVVPGNGSTSPSGYQVTLNSGCSLNYLRTRTTLASLPTISAPPPPIGTRIVTINNTGQSCGDPATLRDLTLNGNVGLISLPPGTYGNFTVNSGSGLVLGVAGGLQTANYNLQNLNLNGNSTLKVVGPVSLTVAHGFTANGKVGATNNPGWLQLNVASGGFTLNSGCAVYGLVTAPSGTVIVNASSTLVGASASDQFILNGGGLVQWSSSSTQTNRPPVAMNQTITLAENSSTNITLIGSDPQGLALTFSVLTQPAHGTLSGTPPNVTYRPAANYFGNDAFTFKVNNGITDSAPATISLIVTQVYYPPVAYSQTLTNFEDTVLPVTLAGSDPQGYALTYSMLTQPAHGTLSGTAPNLSYLPATNYFGNDSFTFRVNDGVGNSAPATISITNQPVDDPPVVVAGPNQLIILPTNTISLSGSVTYDVFPGTVDTVLWSKVSGPGRVTFSNPSNTVTLATFSTNGIYRLRLYASDSFLSGSNDLFVTVDAPPVVNAGANQNVPFGTQAVLAGSYTDDGILGPTVTTLWTQISGPADAVFTDPTITNSAVSFSQSGDYVFQLTADDGMTESSAQVTITVLPASPVNHAPVAQPQSLSTIQDTPLNITLTGTDADNDSFNYQVLTQPANGTLTGSAPDLVYQPAAGYTGQDSFTFSVNDGAVDSAPATVSIMVNPLTLPPGVFAGRNHVLLGTNSVALKGQGAERNGDGSLTLTWSVISQPAGTSVQFTDVNDPKAIATFSGPGAYQLRLTAADSRTNASADVCFWVVPALPPDPASVAPPLDQTEPTCLTKATEFLYAGGHPVQIGVAPGTIVFERAALLRGHLLDQQGNGLPGVGVTVLNHPEFGATVSRADGGYDLVVNGGAPLTLNFEKSGFITVQRRADVPWQRYVGVDDVVMTPYDASTNAITFNLGAIQTTAGSIKTDADGTRQATVFFPSGTAAQMVFGGTVTQTVQSLSVRLTEYTAGTNGPQAMPAQLPPNSAYTYCVELGADEAEAAEADTVVFSQPVSFYVENFIGFPAGTAVPVGYYDRQRGCWVPSANGRVITILSNNGGQVALDVDGSGNAATQDELNQLGITYAELAALAQRYQSGQSLWRARISHFTPLDLNWCYIFRLILGGPQYLSPNLREAKPDTDTDDPCHKKGSDIDIQNQVLGEYLPVTDTPFSLHYSSDMVPGRISSRQLKIPIRAGDASLQAQQIIVQVLVAGQEWQQTFDGSSTTPNQTVTYTWDGKDVYGRSVQGEQMAVVKIGYSYPMYYVDYSDNPELIPFFMSLGNIMPYQAWFTRGEAPPEVLWQTYEVPVRNWDNREQGIGGWTLNQLHTYDPETRTLILGDGTRRSALSVNAQVDVLGTEDANFVAVAPDGTVVFSDNNNTIQRRMPDGEVILIAGGGSDQPADGLWATNASFAWISGLMVGPDNGIYLADAANNQIWKVGVDGRLKLIAGNGNRGYSGDGRLATNAELILDQLFDPTGMAVGPDSTLFFCDYGNQALRRVGNDGIITTVAGGDATNTADNIPAPQALLNWPAGLAISPEGYIYVGDANGLHVISPNGIISRIPYNNQVVALALGPDHSLYINNYSHIDELKPDGTIVRIAGADFRDWNTLNYNGAAALQFPFYSYSLAVGPDNHLYFGTGGISPGGGNLWRISLPLPGLAREDIAIASEDGSELYYFIGTGKHLATVDTLTGKALYQFGYDATGLLVTITDIDGDVTTIERDAQGQAIAIVSSDGHRTTLGYDANGWLNRVANPASQAYSMTYTIDGLLTQFTNPRNHASTISYDATGRLQTDANAAGGSQTLGRNDYDNGAMVSLLTAMNYDPATYAVQRATSPDNVQYEYRENVAPDGSTNRSLIGADGSTTVQDADGTTTSSQDGPDPRWGLQAPITANLTITLPSGNSMITASSRTVGLSDASNPLSLMAETNVAIVNNEAFTSIYNFDGVNRTVTASSPLGRISVSTLDANGRVIQTAVPEIAPVNYQYDSHGRLVTVSQSADSQTRTTTYTYDQTQNGGASSGRLIATADSLNRTTTFTYDPNLSGRVIRQTFPNGRYIQFQYDANGNLTGVTPPQKPEHLFDFNTVDLLDQYTPPPAPNTGNNFTTYAYNLNQQLTNVTRPDGLQINFTYDPHIGWLNNVLLPSGEDIGYTYVQNGCGCSGVGRPESVTFHAVDYTSVIHYTYDGSLVTGVAWTGPVTGSVNAGYDNFFRVNSLSVNGANPVAFGYDDDGLLIQAGDLTLARDTLNGRLTGTTIGHVSDNWTYNGFGEAQGYTASANGNTVFFASFARDNAGRIVTRTETIGGVTSTYTYTYDPARGWLTDVTSNGVPVAHYDYDDNGNRTHALTPDREVTYAAADDQDRILSATETLPMQLPQNVSWTYTANGELQSKMVGAATTSYSYDVRGNLRDVTLPDGRQIEYVIDATGRRTGEKVNDTLVKGWLYQDSLKPIAELDANGNIVSRFIYAGKANVPEYMIKNGIEYRLITDQLGSVRLVVNVNDGSIVQRLDYDEFGRVLADSNPGLQPFGFAGGLYAPDTGLVHFGARDYDADTGRWTSKDEIGFVGGDANIYEYVHSDPINSSDPFGLLDCATLESMISNMEGIIHNALQSMGSGGDVQQVFGAANRMWWAAAAGEVAQAGATITSLVGDLAAKAPVLFNQAGKEYVISARGLARAKGTSTYYYTLRRAIAQQKSVGLETGVTEVKWDVGNEIASDTASKATGLPVNIMNEAEAVSEREVEMANDMSALTYNTIQRLQAQLAGMLNTYRDCCR
jgi:RHS repeat-associated protein